MVRTRPHLILTLLLGIFGLGSDKRILDGNIVDTFSSLLPFVNYGILGLLVIMLFTGFLYTKNYVDEMRERQKKEVEEYKQALAFERQRNEVGELSGRILHELLTELRKEIKL